MLPSPGQIGTTILGAGSEFVTFYLIIMLSGPVALGTIIFNHQGIYNIDCIPNCTDCQNSTFLKPSSAAFINSECILELKLYPATYNCILVIGLTFGIFLIIYFLGTSTVPQACLDQLLKDFSEIDSDSASKIVSVMEIWTRDELQIDENTDKRVVSMVRHIYGRAKAGKGLLMIKRTLVTMSIFLSLIVLVILINAQVVNSGPQVEELYPTCVLPDLDGSGVVTFVCSRNRSLDEFLGTTQTILLSLVAIYTSVQLIQLTYSFRYLRIIGCCASKRQKDDYWAVEEARWLFRTRFGYDYKPEQAPRAVHENVEINAGE